MAFRLYVEKHISPDTDQVYSADTSRKIHTEGYFIHAHCPGLKQKIRSSHAYILKKKDFHKMFIMSSVAEDKDSEMHIITGCATAPHLKSGLHIGVSEFYVKKRRQA